MMEGLGVNFRSCVPADPIWVLWVPKWSAKAVSQIRMNHDFIPQHSLFHNEYNKNLFQCTTEFVEHFKYVNVR